MAEFPELPGRSGDALRAWLSAGGAAAFHDELRAWLKPVPREEAAGYLAKPPRREWNQLYAWAQQARGRLEFYDWLWEGKHASDGSPPEEWESESVPWVQWARELPVNRLYRALQDVAEAKGAKAGRAPGARAQLADALERANGVQAAAEAEYESTRVGLNDATAQVAASTRVGKNGTPSAPVLTPVTLK